MVDIMLKYFLFLSLVTASLSYCSASFHNITNNVPELPSSKEMIKELLNTATETSKIAEIQLVQHQQRINTLEQEIQQQTLTIQIAEKKEEISRALLTQAIGFDINLLAQLIRQQTPTPTTLLTINTLESALNQTKEEVTFLQAQWIEDQLQSSTLESLLNAKTQTVDTLQIEQQTLSAQVDQLTKEKDALKTKCTDLQRKTQEDIQSLQAQLIGAEALFQTKHAALESRLNIQIKKSDQLTKERDVFEKQCTDLQRTGVAQIVPEINAAKILMGLKKPAKRKAHEIQ